MGNRVIDLAARRARSALKVVPAAVDDPFATDDPFAAEGCTHAACCTSCGCEWFALKGSPGLAAAPHGALTLSATGTPTGYVGTPVCIECQQPWYRS